MQQIVAIPEIKSRAEACGCTLGKLAKRAGIDRTTAYRAVKDGAEPRLSTARALTAALLELEAERRAQLEALKPAEERAA